MPVADPLKKQIAQKARLHMKICISCGARLDISATRCRKCRSTSLRLKNRQLGICLLYTSPSPRDATLSRMPSSA